MRPAAAVAEPADAELARLRRENAQLRRANEILKTASAFFAQAELDRKRANEAFVTVLCWA